MSSIIPSKRKVETHTFGFVYASDLVRELTKDTRMYQRIVIPVLEAWPHTQYVEAADFAVKLENELASANFRTQWKVIMLMIGEGNWVCLR